jgi:hypothetical protein
VRERADSRVLERAVVVPLSRFNQENLETISRDFLSSTRQYAIAKLSIFADSSDLDRTLSGGKSPDISYPEWLERYTKYAVKPMPMAEVIRIGSRSVLRFLDQRGGVNVVPLEGADALSIRVGDARLDILHVAFKEVPNFIREREAEIYTPVFFILADKKLDVETGATAAHLLAHRTGIGSSEVNLSRTPWFFQNTLFPITYRFLPGTPAPTSDQFLDSQVLSCTAAYGSCLWEQAHLRADR